MGSWGVRNARARAVSLQPTTGGTPDKPKARCHHVLALPPLPSSRGRHHGSQQQDGDHRQHCAPVAALGAEQAVRAAATLLAQASRTAAAAIVVANKNVPGNDLQCKTTHNQAGCTLNTGSR